MTFLFMKRIKLLLLAVICTLAANAQLNGDGYYRVRSSLQQRYVRVLDNRGSINMQTTDADLDALCTQRSWNIVVSDPGSVIYIKKMSAGYDLQSQGTGSYAIISYEVRVADMGDNKYWCYASNGAMTKYLADEKIVSWAPDDIKERGHLVTNIGPSQGEYLDFDVLPVEPNGCFFGLTPNVKVGDNYYQTFYADFPFNFYSEGMEAWYVDGINETSGKVSIKEITGGVPRSTPVIVKCSAQAPDDNKLNVGASTSGSASGNKLKGVYFCNPNALKHTNVVAYDPNTMRVLGKAPNGRLAFIKDSELQYIPANSAYITVSTSAPDVLEINTGDEPVLTSVSIKADDKKMVYGDAVPELTYTVTEGTAYGTPELSCEATSKSSVGTYPINIDKGTLTNDIINLTDGTLTINRAPLTITAKSYTIKVGDELPTFEVTYSGFKNDETEEVLTKKPVITCSATSESAPGEYEITVSGAKATDYKISYVAGKLTIAEEAVYIKADDKTMTYGDPVPELTYTVTEGTANGTPELTCEATSKSPVGTYTINIDRGTLTNDNINLTNGTLTINKAQLTITAKSYTIKVGDELPTFEVTYSGFKNGETEEVLTKKPVITCSATSESAPGEYDILVSGAKSGNYDITYVAGKLTIKEKESVSIKADDKTMTYGDAIPELTYTVIEGTADGTPELSCEATSKSPVGTYTINIDKGTLTNDIIYLTEGTLTINKAPLYISAYSYEITVGDDIPDFELYYSGFKNGETEDVLTKKPTITCSATKDSAPGAYDIIVSGAEADNYNITHISGTLLIKEPVEIIVDDDGSEYIVEDNNTLSFAGNPDVDTIYEIPQTVKKNGKTYTVTTIARGAFQGQSTLTEITIPESIVAIGGSAFEGCTSLVLINSKPIVPPTLYDGDVLAMRRASSVFSGVNKETCVLYVPTGCVDAYKNADGWKDFLHIQDGSTAIRTITFDGKAYDIFDLNGRKVRENATTLDGLSKGMYIVNGRKYMVK
jgi:hypothetical protein